MLAVGTAYGSAQAAGLGKVSDAYLVRVFAATVAVLVRAGMVALVTLVVVIHGVDNFDLDTILGALVHMPARIVVGTAVVAVAANPE